MNIEIRQANPDDYPAIFSLIEEAFTSVLESDHREQFLVEKLRESSAFIPELSLIATAQGKIIGHILLTQIQIINKKTKTPSLALAPVSVLPKYQNKGIGTQLILAAHEISRKLAYTSIMILGHKDYYPRFGYKLASSFKIKFPFEFPDEYCMALELTPNSLKNITGTLQYSPPFLEN